MLSKYNDLINMLITRGYNVSTFEELDNEYSAIVYNNSNIYANIYLENTLEIYIHNEESGINGKFQLTRLSIPLTYNGMMSINATKIKDKIYLGG